MDGDIHFSGADSDNFLPQHSNECGGRGREFNAPYHVESPQVNATFHDASYGAVPSGKSN